MKPAKRCQTPRHEQDALLHRCRADVSGQVKSHNATNAGKTDREALDTWLAFTLTSLVGMFLVSGGVFLLVNGSVNHVTDFVILGSGGVVLGVTCSLVAGLRLMRHVKERRKLPEHRMVPEDQPAENIGTRAGNPTALQTWLETPDVFVLDKVTRSQHIAHHSDVMDDNDNNNVVLKRVTFDNTKRVRPQSKVASRPQATDTRDVCRKANDVTTDVQLISGSCPVPNGACATMSQKYVPLTASPRAATILTTVAEINQWQSATKHKLTDSGQSSIESLEESLGQLGVSGPTLPHMAETGYERLGLLTSGLPLDNSIDHTYKKDGRRILNRASHKGGIRPTHRYSCLDEIELLTN
ncbi:uncharacterized protein LOC131930071 [Physella acuta]|uniref:uncharacterized protein LOC131930071 n=1 Tax=Physella acuta TaxID=109671 RepID=UPI0027DCC8A0|nr:uncharacterized protein LOC131930071 [Physella acuta]